MTNNMMIQAAVNQAYIGKMPKNASPQEWAKFNDRFQTRSLTVDELLAEIRKGHAFTCALKPNTRRKAENFASAQHIGLDFDTEDDRSSLDSLAADPFINQYGMFLYTSPSHTPEKPRARVVFVLDQPVEDASLYGQMVSALVHKYDLSDEHCSDTARLWYGSQDCEIRKLGNILPVNVIKPAVAPQDRNNHHPSTNLTRNPDKWLRDALARTTNTTSDNTGLWLANMLRDDGYSDNEIMPVLWDYANQATFDPEHPFTEKDAKRWLKSSRTRPPREPARSRSPLAQAGTAHGEASIGEPPPQPDSDDRKKKIIKSAEYIAVLKSLDYTFRMNQCSDRVEVNGEPLSDAVESVISSKLRDAGYPHVNVARDAYIASAYYNSYHPIRDYLATLPPGEPGHIHRLASYFDNPDGTFKLWLKRWLIGAVRRAYQPGEQNRVLVLDGPQNIGKSKFTEWLAPDVLRGKHFKSGPIYPDDKDCKIALTERWIWEVAELGSTTRRTDREALKFFVSLELVTMRPPYGRYEIQKPALSNFIGTVNNEHGLLSDPTGNRRYMFAKINSINWHGYTRNIDVNNIWAEALMLYQAGESADLTTDEIQTAEAINNTYKVEEPLEGIILEHFEVDPSHVDWWTATYEILQELENPEYNEFNKPTRPTYRGTTGMTTKLLASLMTELGCQRKRAHSKRNTSPVWGYLGVRKL